MDSELLFSKIEDIIIKTCIAFEPLLSDQNGKSNYLPIKVVSIKPTILNSMDLMFWSIKILNPGY